MSIPNKLYFRIGEVADILEVKPYVLRYWETEFPDIRPSKSKSGQRLYKRRDVELLMQIKTLLYNERFTIDGARKRLRDQLRELRQNGSDEVVEIEAPAPVSTPPKMAEKPPSREQMSLLNDTSSSKLLTHLKRDLELILANLQP